MSALLRTINNALPLQLTLTSIRPLENIPETTMGVRNELKALAPGQAEADLATVISTTTLDLNGSTKTQTAGAGC